MNEKAPRNVFKVQGTAKERYQFESHGRFHPKLLSGVVRLKIKTLSPLHCGSGLYGLDASNNPIKLMVRRAGVPVIPGTSLKGVVRQLHESLTESLGPSDSDPPPGRDFPTLSTRIFGNISHHRDVDSHQGQVSFDDAIPTKSVEPISTWFSVPYPPPDKEEGRRFYGLMPARAVQHSTIRAEAIAAGITLETFLRFLNLNEASIGSMLLALGLDLFTPRVGGGKYDYAGWVRIEVAGLRLRRGLIDEEEILPESSEELAQWVRKYRSHFDVEGSAKDALSLFKERLQGPDRRDCKTGGHR